MNNQIKYTLKNDLKNYLIVIAVTVAATVTISIIAALSIKQSIFSLDFVDMIFTPILIATMIANLVRGIETAYYLRFYMQLGSSRTKSFVSTMIAFLLGAVGQAAFILLILFVSAPEGITQFIPLFLLGLVGTYFLGMFANSLCTVLKPMFTIPLLIAYFGYILPNIGFYIYESRFLYPLAILFVLLNAVAAYVLYNNRSSIIKGVQI
ncbi:MAG: hypothetical protein GX903_00975 [Spirochaetales bacterium]|nr:hypothetical protein [Spirochaetales bacterium]